MTADELLLSLEQPVAVVGNGTIRDCSNQIEAHRSIIRFNNFVLPGYERHVGTTEHVWCVDCNEKVSARKWKRPMLTVVTAKEQPLRVARWLEKYPQLCVPGESWIREAKQVKPMNPSTGFSLLCRMLKHKITCTAFGFDGLRSGHYWDPTHQHDVHPDEFPELLRLVGMGLKVS